MTGTTSELRAGHFTGRLSPMRRARWFRWVLLAAVLCTVGLYTAEFSHHHETPAAELHCPICQVMAHSALDVFSPQFKPLPPVTRIHFLALAPRITPIPGRIFTVKHQPRAPPAL
ncbi:MAG: DUF2946 family protein [Gammaproteobacteria bacterium]